MKTLPDKLSNSWEIELLQSYCGKYASFFTYKDEIITCVVPKDSGDCCFQLEMMTNEEQTVCFYLQPIDESGESTDAYVTINKVDIANPESHEEMQRSVSMIFEAMHIERRLSENEIKV